jgi:hypothetical protein
VPVALADLETRPRRSVDMPADAATIKAYLASHVPEAHAA